MEITVEFIDARLEEMHQLEAETLQNLARVQGGIVTFQMLRKTLLDEEGGLSPEQVADLVGAESAEFTAKEEPGGERQPEV